MQYLKMFQAIQQIKQLKVQVQTPHLIVIVNGLTVTMLKDGLSRVQAFYKKNGRLPNYVNYGIRQIPISTFEKNLSYSRFNSTRKPKS